jgi:hypothetical protein
VFDMDVAKIDRDVANVAMVIYVCCKRPFQVFHLLFSYVCCKCAYLNVAQVSYICLKVLCLVLIISDNT